MIHDVSRNPPSDSAIAGVAVARSVWSTAAMNIGRKTATKRFRNWARVTVAGGAPEAAATAASVPAIVANLDDAVLDAHREFRGGLVGRRGERFPGLDAEARAVTRADHLVALDEPAGSLPAVVRPHVLYRVVLAADVEHGHTRAVDVHHAVAAGRQLAHLRYGDPVRHDLLFLEFLASWRLIYTWDLGRVNL